MRTLLTGIAIVALAVGSASAKPGGGNGGGNDHGGGHGNGGDGQMMMAQPGGGNGHGNGGGNGPGNGNGKAKADNPGNGGGKMDRGPVAEAGKWADKPGKAMKDNGPGRAAEKAFKDNGKGNGNRPEMRGPALRQDDVRVAGRDDRGGRDDTVRVVWRDLDQNRGLANGCPPGLAKKNNGCMPPGLAKQQNYWGTSGDWWNLRNNVSLSDYRYYDGSMVRLDTLGRIVSYYPLLGGSLIPGAAWPSMFTASPLPSYYQDYYGLGSDYRYADGAIYRLDPTTQAIQSIAALLTGDNFAVGQPLPTGYNVYNVPYQYRDQYVDGADGYYRYSDGYVYQVDPTTQLIKAAIKLLT